MKYLGKISETEDLTNKTYIDDPISKLGNAIGMQGWNQLIYNTSFTNTTTDTRTYVSLLLRIAGGSNIYAKNISSATELSDIFTAGYGATTCWIGHTGASTDIRFQENITITAGHKYAIHANFTSVNPSVVGGIVVNNLYLIDLTALYGSGSEPSTVAEFRKMFPADCYPYCNKTEGSGLVTITSSTTLSTIGTITMPAGTKILRVSAVYNHSSPIELILTDDTRYERYGNVTASSSITTQYLTLTTLTTAETMYVMAKYADANENSYTYYYKVL